MPLIRSVNDFLDRIDRHTKANWSKPKLRKLLDPKGKSFPERDDLSQVLSVRWFRGQAQHYPLIPKVYRSKYAEREMLMQIIRQAGLMDDAPVDRGSIPSWYFLLQHHDFPTRLLDWTENPLVALFFAVEEWASFKKERRKMHPIVWLLNPHALNWVLSGSSILPGALAGEVVTDGTGHEVRSPCIDYIQQSLLDARRLRPPLAISGTYVHVRMQTQKSTFTIHGSAKRDLKRYLKEKGLLSNGFAALIQIDGKAASRIASELRDLGVSRSTIYPGLDAICRDFTERYRI